MNGKNGKEQIEAAAEETAGVIAEAAGRVRSAATDAGNTAQEYVREAGRQAGAAAQTAYGTGNEMLNVVEDMARQNIWTSLLVAGAVGYGLAYLIKQR